MKYWLITIILILVFIPMLVATGQNIDERPLVVYEQKYSENALEKQRLIATFGREAFLECFNCISRDTGNPFAQAACLSIAEYCLRGEEIKEIECGNSGYVYSNGRCVTMSEGCREQYGQFSYARGIDNDRKVICHCVLGFGWNNDRTRCVQTGCGDGYIYWSQYRNLDGSFLHGRCMTRGNACRNEFGEYSVFTRMDAGGTHYCGCGNGYMWSEDGRSCEEAVVVLGYASPAYDQFVYEQTIAEEKNLLSYIDEALSKRLSGQILLQVEKSGEAWYIYPDDQKKYFLGSPYMAFALMQNLGLGATHEFITGYTVFPEHVSGRILIDVEDSGRAYYIYPGDMRAYYLGRPEDAFAVMRNLGLGITNYDIRRIDVGEI